MSSNGVDSPKQASPYRPRHQISRSITEISHPRRLGRHHPQQQARKDRDRDEKISVPQSAAPVLQVPLRTSLDATRSEGVTPGITPNMSPMQSRRTSVLVTATEDGMLPRKLTKEEIQAEREKATARASALKQSLAELQESSTTTTRRLDDAYYAVLEKLSNLQNTIGALRDLATMARETNDAFTRDAHDLVTEAAAQLDALGRFDGPEDRIRGLRERVAAGRTRIGELSARVDAVQGRVEGWNRADREWQEKTRKRLTVVWVVTSIAVFVVVLLFVSAQYAPQGLEEATVRLANETIAKMRSGAVGAAEGGEGGEGGGNESIWEGAVRLQESIHAAGGRRPLVGDPGDRLRAFDEL